eukprot:1195683-Prorocentrum_minimum.AAC.4
MYSLAISSRGRAPFLPFASCRHNRSPSQRARDAREPQNPTKSEEYPSREGVGRGSGGGQEGVSGAVTAVDFSVGKLATSGNLTHSGKS